MEKKREKIKLSILLPLALAILVLLFTSIISIYSLQRQNIKDGVQRRISGVKKMFQSRMEQDAQLLNGLLDSVKGDKILQEAWITGDRETLLRHGKELYKDLYQKYNLTRFSFYKPDRTCFLYVHNPSADRGNLKLFTLQRAAQTGSAVHGIEVSPIGTLSLHSIHPWWIDGKLVGYIELAEGIRHIAPQLQETLDAELIFTINKSYIDHEKWEQRRKELASKTSWEQFSHFVIVNHTLNEIPTELNEYIKFTPTEYENMLFSISSSDRHYRGGYVNLRDAGGRRIGDIVVLTDVTEEQISQTKLSAVLIAVCAVIALILFVLFFFHINHVEAKLAKERKSLQTEIQEHMRTETELKKERDRVEKARTEAKKINRQLQFAVQRAVEADLTKSQFIANMSHEIRTPMNAIIGFSEVLYESELSQEQRNHADIIRQSGKNLLQLINDILDFSKIEADKLEIRPIDVLLKKLLETLESLLQPGASKKAIDFKITTSEELPAVIHTDPMRLHQCLINIIGNAIKFTEKGHVWVNTSLVKINGNDFVQFEIEDTGIGIPPEMQQAIFDAFVQADADTTRKYGGTGLGLAITKKLVTLLNGELTLMSEIGKGSTFRLTVPVGLDIKEQPQISQAHDLIEDPKDTPTPLDDDIFSGNILVAEDTKTNQILIRLLLEKMGLNVTIAKDGQEAVDKAMDGTYDLIFMDIHMPNKNGYDATKELRKKGFASPIVALTASVMKGDNDKCMAAGCNDYLSKPIDRKMLLQIIRKYLVCNVAASQKDTADMSS